MRVHSDGSFLLPITKEEIQGVNAMSGYMHDQDDADEILELKQAIVDLFLEIKHDSNGRWIIPTFGGYVMPELSKALDNALKVAIRQRNG